jgi:anthranilate synthase component 2
MSRTIIIDNYDSFTYNLVQLVNELQDSPVVVKRNNETSISEVSTFEHIILSPGPGLPNEAGLLKQIIKDLGPTHKIFGVCLGLQAIAEVYGSTLKNLDTVFHGIQSKFETTAFESPIFKGIKSPFQAGRYHSWVIDKSTLKDILIVTATDESNEIMAIQHIEHKVYGVQFHPESIMTPFGKTMLNNFLSI